MDLRDFKNLFQKKPKKLELELKNLPALTIHLPNSYGTKELIDYFMKNLRKSTQKDYIEKFSCKGADGQCEPVDAFLKVTSGPDSHNYINCIRYIPNARGSASHNCLCNVGSLDFPEDFVKEGDDLREHKLASCPYARNFK